MSTFILFFYMSLGAPVRSIGYNQEFGSEAACVYAGKQLKQMFEASGKPGLLGSRTPTSTYTCLPKYEQVKK